MRETLMRVPHNDRVNEPSDEPERRCILTGERAPKAGLIRLALGPDGQVAPDVRAKAPGRGAWIGVDRSALEVAMAKGKLKGGLARAHKTSSLSIPDDLAERVEKSLEQATLNRLGLEARAGELLTGSDRIEEAARRGQLALLLHSSDAANDGKRKLAQAWRVGREEEGTGLSGVTLPVDRDRLSAALGRENTVHIGVSSHAAAKRISADLDRWIYFIGAASPPDLAESPPKVQGSAAHDIAKNAEKQEAGLEK
jgi:uncharacterized protein